MFKKVIKYLEDVKNEMAKVNWPTRLELRDSAMVVVVLSLILAAFVFGIDQILNGVLKVIF